MMVTARILFAITGVFWLLIGVLAGPLDGRGIGPTFIFISPRTDAALYGGPPDEILNSNSSLTIFRYTAIRVMGGLLMTTGLLTASLAWYGLREPRIWVLTILTIVGLGVIPFWWVSLTPYRDAGIKLALVDIPPFMWVAAVTMPVASILGWIDQLQH